MAGHQPVVRREQPRYSGAHVDEGPGPGALGGSDERLSQVDRAGHPIVLYARRLQQRRRPRQLGRRHARAAGHLFADTPRRYVGKRQAGRAEIGFGHLAPARAEVRDDVRVDGQSRRPRSGERPREERAGRQNVFRRSGESNGGNSGSFVAGTDHEQHVGMLQRELVDDRIDGRVSLDVIAHAETHVENDREASLLSKIGDVVHRADHAARHREATPRVVGDLRRDQLRARSDPVESLDAEHVMAGGDPCHVTTVRGIVKEEIQGWCTIHFRHVHG